MQMKYFMRLWAMSAVAAFVGLFVVLAAWLVVHLGFVDETISLMLGYISNSRLMILALVASALIGLVEATVITFWQRRSSKRV